MTNTRHTPLRGHEGYTLVEILIVLVIMGILSQVAVPSLAGVLTRSRTRQAVGQLAADLSYARMLAIRSGRGATVVFDNPTTYRIKEGVGAAGTVRKTVDLTRDYNRVTLQRPTGVDSVVFTSRGIVATTVPIGTGKFLARTNHKGQVRSDSLQLRLLGHVQRLY